MATQFSMLGIMNAALLAQGELEVATENDGSLEFRTMFRNWPLIVEAELEDGGYHFNKQQSHLVTRIDGKFGFNDGYRVPDAALHVRRLWVLNDLGETCQIDWMQDGSYVYVNNPEGVYIEWVDVAGQDLWSATFSLGIKQRMEALILRAVKEEFREATQMDQQAEVTLQRARTNSSKAKSAKPAYQKGSIARARHRRG